MVVFNDRSIHVATCNVIALKSIRELMFEYKEYKKEYALRG
jgi:hypothetical protein